jgi:hypothetical protein
LIGVYVPTAGPVRLEWVAKSGYYSAGVWLELKNVQWAPYVETPLAESLDAGAGVTWTTSTEYPFTGRPNPGAQGGTAATAELPGGEETWLEATVDGPGIMDFSLRSSPLVDSWNAAYLTWEVFVDGQRVAISGNEWPPQWIAGAGTHHVRWVFKNPLYAGVLLVPVVDGVSWTPLVAATAGPEWTGSAGEVKSFANGGNNGAAQVVIRGEGADEAWVERTATGPGYLEWDAISHFVDPDIDPHVELTLDGVAAVQTGYSWDGWTHFRLNLPAGPHQVRWTLKGDAAEIAPATTDFSCPLQLSGFAFTGGPSPLAEVVGQPALTWLEIGESGTTVTGAAAMDGVDAWSLAAKSEIYLLNLSSNALTVRGGFFTAETPVWTIEEQFIQPGKAAYWAGTTAYGFATYVPPLIIDAVTVETAAATSLAEALDLPAGNFSSDDWVGLVSASESHDGEDAARSEVSSEESYHSLTLKVKDASKIRFHWRSTGAGKLTVSLNGYQLPLAPPTAEWSDVEVTVRERSTLEWHHEGTAGTSADARGHAWVDEVSQVPVASWSLDDAAANGRALGLVSSVTRPDPRGWEPMAIQQQGGEIMQGARAVTGTSEMTMQVTGPATLTFRGRCFPTEAVPTTPQSSGTGDRIGRDSSLTLGGGAGTFVRHELALKIDGVVANEISWDSGRNGVMSSVYVPMGTHQLSWRLEALYYNSYNGSSDLSPSPLSNLEGWVSDITLKTSRDFYNEWTAERLAPGAAAGPGDDADGDGASNLEEFAYGTLPLDRTSVPAKVYGAMGRATGVSRLAAGTPLYSIYVPYLNPFANVVLENSLDLQDWMAVSNLTDMAPGVPSDSVGIDGWPLNTATHQVRTFPVLPGVPARYFRVKLTLPDN